MDRLFAAEVQAIDVPQLEGGERQGGRVHRAPQMTALGANQLMLNP